MDADVVTPRDWDDDEREMMRFLLLGGSPSGVDENDDDDDAQQQQENPAPKSKAKLSALERREKHREVVKRSYHRSKVNARARISSVAILPATRLGLLMVSLFHYGWCHFS